MPQLVSVPACGLAASPCCACARLDAVGRSRSRSCSGAGLLGRQPLARGYVLGRARAARLSRRRRS